MNFGEKVKQLRKTKRINQQDLADALGVHLNTVSRWENLKEPIDDLTKLADLSHELGTTVSYLRGDSDNVQGDPIKIQAGEYVEITPNIEKIGNGHIFCYEYNGQKVEIPASKEFIDLFLRAIKEMRSNDVTEAMTVTNQANAYDNANAKAVAMMPK